MWLWTWPYSEDSLWQSRLRRNWFRIGYAQYANPGVAGMPNLALAVVKIMEVSTRFCLSIRYGRSRTYDTEQHRWSVPSFAYVLWAWGMEYSGCTLYMYFHTILFQSKILHPFFPDRVYSKTLQGSTYQCAVYHSQIVSQSDRWNWER